MSKLTGPVDALLAARLAPRLESIATAAGIATGVATNAPTGPVVKVAGVENDPRLPSGTVLEQQLPARVSAGASPLAPASPSAPRLSAAARIIGALLAELHDAGPVRGTKPLLASSSQAPAQAVLAGALAQTVADSGLFYESHLRQFVAGTRTLAQLATEPQARFAAAQMPGPASLPVTAATPQALPVVTAPAAGIAGAAAVAAASIDMAESGEGADAKGASAAPATAPSPAPATDAMRVQAAYGWSAPAVSAPGAAAASAWAASPAQPVDEAARPAASALAAAEAPAAAEIIHPQAATVVHQQLDLLATAVFRWSGQAWPGVPMEWSIREEAADTHADADTDAPDAERARSWTTTVSLVLPRLGAVDLRLSLAGAVVQAQVTVGKAATLARLQGGRGGLAQRLEGAGLHLQALQITAMPPAAAGPGAHAS